MSSKSDIALSVRGLSKAYTIAHDQEKHVTLAEQALSRVRNPLRRPKKETFWALKDINFDIKKGDVVGIIGRNGAGKSTLLKILSRITEPTTGQIDLFGRVSSLLEVGTGFHPELTGRENIFLNGAILGMAKPLIRKQFDAIVDFAEVEKFIDTPVKRYSSGMYVRLAFAVAAHLNTEILIVDEVLSVGDAQFQKKCLGKMRDTASQEGRTVLFISHNMHAVHNLCKRVIWLDHGRIRETGGAAIVIDNYLSDASRQSGPAIGLRSDGGELEIERVVLSDSDGNPSTSFSPGDGLIIDVHYMAHAPVLKPYLWLSIESQFGGTFGANMLMDGHRPDVLSGAGVIRAVFPTLPLSPQQSYIVWLGVRPNDGQCALVKSSDVGTFRVTGTAADLGLLGDMADSLIGTSSPVLVPYRWEFPDGRDITVNPLEHRAALQHRSSTDAAPRMRGRVVRSFDHAAKSKD